MMAYFAAKAKYNLGFKEFRADRNFTLVATLYKRPRGSSCLRALYALHEQCITI